MDHAVLVGVRESMRGFPRDAEGLGGREPRRPPEPVAEAFAFDVGHGVPQPAGGLARLEDGQDVRVLQSGGGRDFAQESLGTELDREPRLEDLERDRPLQPDLSSQIDRRHSAASDLPLHHVSVPQRIEERRAGRGARRVSGSRHDAT